MPEPRQGEVWWANLPEPAGRRPVLILTRTDATPRLHSVTIAPLTRTIRDIDTEAVISAEDGVPTLCAASLDNILTIPKTLLAERITQVSEETMADVFRALRAAFRVP